jgi:iron complex outermembrane receptor protein
LALAAAAALAATLTAPPALAQDSAAELASLSLDTLLDLPVSGASKFEQRMSETAASVTVITAAEIRALGYRTLADVLRSVRGLTVADDRSYSYMGVRGFFAPGDYNTRVLLLVDGYRTNDNVYDQAYLGGEFPLDLDLVDRVEFIPGPGSAVYGANALFGVVNVITRKPGTPGSDGAALTLGSAGTKQLRVGDTHALADGTRLQWSVSRRLVDGTDVTLPGEGTARGTDYERRTSLYLRAQHDELTATAMHAERLKGAPIMPGAVFGDPRTSNRDEHSMLDLTWQHPLDAHDESTARWFTGHYLFQGRYAVDYPPVTVNMDDVSGQWWGLEARWLTTRWQNHKLVAGLELQDSPNLTQRNFDVDSGLVYLDDRRGSHRAGLFAEDQIALTAQWSLVAGGRWDHNHDYPGQFNPRLALLWHPDQRFVAKLIHGDAYRTPNAYEAYYHVDTVGGYKVNPSLRAESVSGDELALEWQPDAHQRINASLYANRARHLVVLTQDPADGLLVFQNLGSFSAQGLEIEYERQWHHGARLRASVSFERNGDSGGAMAVAGYSPRRMAKLAGIVPLGGDWSLGTEWQGYSRRSGAPGHGVANVNLSKSLPARGWSVGVGVQDLFDRRHDDPGPDVVLQPSVPQAGRSWQLRLDYAF